LHPFDTYMYMLQAEVYPESRHSSSPWSVLILPQPVRTNTLFETTVAVPTLILVMLFILVVFRRSGCTVKGCWWSRLHNRRKET
jgi:hypothetical protein